MKHLNSLIQCLILVGLGVAFTGGCGTPEAQSAMDTARKVVREADKVCAQLKPALSALVIDHHSFCALSTDYQATLPAGVLYEITRLCSLPDTTNLTAHVELVCSGIEQVNDILP